MAEYGRFSIETHVQTVALTEGDSCMAGIQLVFRPVSASSFGAGLDAPNLLGGYQEFVLYTNDAGQMF